MKIKTVIAGYNKLAPYLNEIGIDNIIQIIPYFTVVSSDFVIIYKGE